MEEFQTFEESNEKTSELSKCLIRLVALITLAGLLAALLKFNRDNATLQIAGVFDINTKLSIKDVDITIKPAENSSREVEADVYLSIKPPARFPIPGGKCSSVLVEADGYHDWKHLFCPSYSEVINIELNLIPSFLPKPFPQEFET
jgi:hypothetical protein